MAILGGNPAGPGIKVKIIGPESVTPGEEFSYEVQVLDVDASNSLNPTGFDSSVRIDFQIFSMASFKYEIATSPNSEGALVCNIVGLARNTPGSYVDAFKGSNNLPGLFWDSPVIETHLVKIK